MLSVVYFVSCGRLELIMFLLDLQACILVSFFRSGFFACECVLLIFYLYCVRTISHSFLQAFCR